MNSASLAACPQQNLHRVFVYGTLLADEVIHILLKRIPKSSAAVLNHYQRLSIKGRVYPAIIPVDSKKVSGKILFDITDTEMHILDTFEDVEYKRSTVEVSLMDSFEKLLVYAYVWCNEKDPDLYGDWDFEEWKRVHLDAYIEMVNDFMEEFEPQPASEQ
ncbi:AIG2-like protein D isoform X2 [Momordica charantia]|uniref:Putative gamma-glutamylcyclotransferase n=1 Tax=Momordica charantia TaxID=3673 RepID=A0A6J1C047_MOMCH|nr:AIG2-like protein D isoform X2 [Momordica charantia]XP_022135085.1 AIG2-like protein D isoform X2 [Momordica charantia]